MGDHAAVQVVVVGAGIMGSAVAWQLARRGRDVVIHERFGPDHALGGSHGDTRIFRAGYASAHHVRLVERARSGWLEVGDLIGAPLLEQTGAVDHGTPESVVQRAASLERFGIEHELMSEAEATARWPGLRFEAGPVLSQPSAGRIHSARALRAFRQLAEEAGARFAFDQAVDAIDRDGEGLVLTVAGQVVRTDVAVVTVGGWAPGLVGHLTALPPLTVRLEQPGHFRPLEDDVGWPSVIHHRELPHLGAYGLMTPGLGMKVALHHAGRAVDPSSMDREVDPQALTTLSDYVEQWLPGVDPQPVEVSTCLYDDTPDLDFVIGRDGPMVLATGFSGHGFKFAPVIGELLADLVEAGPGAGASIPEFSARRPFSGQPARRP